MERLFQEAEVRMALLSHDPEVRRQYEDWEKALFAERSRMEGAGVQRLLIILR